MKKPIVVCVVALLAAALLTSCENIEIQLSFSLPLPGAQIGTTGYPKTIKERVYYYAEQYVRADTVYVWGGQDPLPRVVRVDCSGLVMRCYQYALQGTGYSLIKDDMSSSYMYKNAVTLTDTPEKGDLVFMGDIGSPAVSHVGIFERMAGGYVYFIDSAQYDANNDGKYTGKNDINGVSKRKYPTNDKRIKGYGVMKLKR